MGFSCSYKETINFETATCLAEEPKLNEGVFLQLVFDNADINVRTLDGHNTFHAMGGIICASPPETVNVQESLPRKFVLEKGYKFSTTPIETYIKPSRSGLKSKLVSRITISEPENLLKYQKEDTMYAASLFFDYRPCSWNGFMLHQHRKVTGYLMTKVLPVPFINLDPGNLHTINTALRLELNVKLIFVLANTFALGLP